MYNHFLLPLKPSYVMMFNNQITRFMEGNPSYYESWTEYIFEHLEDLMLSNHYLTVVTMMRTRSAEYIGSLVGDIYDESLVAVGLDLDDDAEEYPGEYTSSYALYDYLYDNKFEVTRCMYAIAHSLIYNVFHRLHHFVVEASKLDITFAEFSLTYPKDHTSLIVTCKPSMEVIKRYDEGLYDRLNMLTPV